MIVLGEDQRSCPTRRDNRYAHKIGSIEQHLNVRVLGG